MKARSLVIAKGNRAVVDLFLINETNKPAGKKLYFYIKDTFGRRTLIGVYSVPQFQKDIFAYPVADSILTPQLNEEGKYQISLQMDNKSDVTSYDTLLVIDPSGQAKNINKKIGVSCDDTNFVSSLSKLLPEAHIEKFRENAKYDLLVVSSVSINNRILQYTEEGTPLLAIPEGENAYLKYAKELGNAGAFKYLGDVGNTRAPWMGSWYFVRKFPVMEGLPVDQAMKSYYQVPAENTDGILLNGKGVDVFIGYGRDHDRNIGAAAFTAHLGKGKILFYSWSRICVLFFRGIC